MTAREQRFYPKSRAETSATQLTRPRTVTSTSSMVYVGSRNTVLLHRVGCFMITATWSFFFGRAKVKDLQNPFIWRMFCQWTSPFSLTDYVQNLTYHAMFCSTCLKTLQMRNTIMPSEVLQPLMRLEKELCHIKSSPCEIACFELYN